MASSMNWLLLAVVACSVFLTGEAITCYTCGSATGRECGDEPDTTALTEVTDCAYCTKTKSTDSHGFHTVYRSCLTQDTVDNSGVTEIKMGCKHCSECDGSNDECICDGDKCNHGNTIFLPITTLIAMVTAVKLFQ